MSETQDERVARLPKWARLYIGRLERDLEYNKARLAEGPEDSDTFADPYSDTPRPLGRGTRIVFRTGPHEWFTVHLDDRGELQVTAGTGMAVMPQAGNVVRIAQERPFSRGRSPLKPVPSGEETGL